MDTGIKQTSFKRQYTNEQCNERNSRTSDTSRTSQFETNERRTKSENIEYSPKSVPVPSQKL